MQLILSLAVLINASLGNLDRFFFLLSCFSAPSKCPIVFCFVFV